MSYQRYYDDIVILIAGVSSRAGQNLLIIIGWIGSSVCPTGILILKVLIVSYHFPPLNTISALRPGKIAKYLPEFAWEPRILTLQVGLAPSVGEIAVEVPEETICRADYGNLLTSIATRRQDARQAGLLMFNGQPTINNPGKWRIFSRFKAYLWRRIRSQFSGLRFPDVALPWVLPAVRKGTELMRREHFDAIFSTFGPPSSHLVAAILAHRFSVPWVADYRDLWTQNHVHPRPQPFQWLEMRYERWLLKSAYACTTVSAPLAAELQQLHQKPVTVIPNGFDAADYVGQYPSVKGQPFTITYTGMIYLGKRDPTIILQAIRLLMDDGRAGPSDIQICFYGADSARALILSLANGLGLEENVQIHPRVALQESIRQQITADMLLLLEWNDPSAKGVYTGKVFEYLGARRPILATGLRGGVIDSLLGETRSGELVTNAAEAARVINHWLDVKRRKGNTRLEADGALILPYTRRWQAGQLADVLNDAVRTGAVSGNPGNRQAS